MTKTEREFVEKLYMELASKLHRYALSTLRDPQLAEEAVQDTFRVVCAKIDSVMASENPRGWVTNAMTLELKKISAERARQADLLIRLAQKASPDEGHRDESDPDLLYSDLAHDEDYILLRTYAESGFTVAGYAKVLGITPSACSKRLQRARKRLEKYFSDTSSK